MLNKFFYCFTIVLFQVGSSTVRLDLNGTIIDREEYYPFGDSSLRTFTYKRYRYVNKERDAESGLYYYGARYYAAWTYRFISVDPLASKYAQLSSYNYADNNPINDYDIDGMQDGNTATTPGRGGSAKSRDGNSNYTPSTNNVQVSDKTKVNTISPNQEALKTMKDISDGKYTYEQYTTARISNARNSEYAERRAREEVYGQDDPRFWMSKEYYNPEMAHFIATKKASENASTAVKWSIWFGYGSEWAAQLYFTRSQMKPEIVTEKINLSTLKLAPNNSFGGNRQINYLKGKFNCTGCAMAGDATLKGNPSSALNHGPTSTIDVLKHFGAKSWSTNNTTSTITEKMTILGDGTTGVIFGYRGTNRMGHYFNVTNKNGTIQFLDFQKAGSAIMNASEFNSFKDFWFINTTRK